MKKFALLIFKTVVSVTLLVYLFRKIDMVTCYDVLSRADLALLSIPVGILGVQTALSALKWQIILRADHIRVPYPPLLRNYLIGNFLSLFLPSSFGGDIYRVYSLKQYNLDSVQNTSSVLFERISGLLALLSLSILSFIFVHGEKVQYNMLLFYVMAIGLFAAAVSDKAVRMLEPLRGRRVGKVVHGIFSSFNIYTKNPSAFAKTVLISFVFQHNIIWIVKLYCMSLGVEIATNFLYIYVPLIYLSEVLPISINGLGIREGAFVYFFTSAGISIEGALSVSLLVIAVRYLFFLTIGGTLFLANHYFKKPPLQGKKRHGGAWIDRLLGWTK